jgi:hypothetical protein
VDPISAQWLLVLLTAIGAGVALWNANSARRSANETKNLVAIEREKLRHVDEPSFRARFEGTAWIRFTLVTGPMAVCEVVGTIPVDGSPTLVDMDSPFALGMMQAGDSKRVKAVPRATTGGVQQQRFILEVTPQDGKNQMIPVVVYCDVKPMKQERANQY